MTGDGGFDFYADAGLVSRLGDVLSQHNGAASPTSNDFEVWLGSPQPDKTMVASTGNIVVTVGDSALGTGHAATAVKLATTQGGLGAGGQSLDTGVASITGGVVNAIAFWLRVTDAVGVAGFSNELSIATNAVAVTG